MHRPLLAGLLLLAPTPAPAVEAHYEAYAAGLNVIDMDADFDVTPERYRVHLAYRTVGAFGLVVRSVQDTVVTGHFDGSQPVPERFFSHGTLRGEPRVTQIDYVAGQPVIRQLVPADDKDREPVAPAQQKDTIDTLSAMAELVRDVNATGRCDGRAMTFDGRRLAQMEAHTSGPQELAATGRSSFVGPTLRCDFVGRQLGGFVLDADRETLQRAQKGTAWFASITPGGPKIPVRIAFQTRFFGEATMYIAAKPPK